ncbi:hypothetical protein VDG1235_4102 [Verrucomicrobiia bacterium DG1235]|nr:hypothetical protein VDG1235_4102 [Verrucomicrobiae bacterium DG1235]
MEKREGFLRSGGAVEEYTPETEEKRQGVLFMFFPVNTSFW